MYADLAELNSVTRLYTRVVNSHPTFDVALANLANAIKDAVSHGNIVKWGSGA